LIFKENLFSHWRILAFLLSYVIYILQSNGKAIFNDDIIHMKDTENDLIQ
jgi:hypothetical protein